MILKDPEECLHIATNKKEAAGDGAPSTFKDQTIDDLIKALVLWGEGNHAGARELYQKHRALSTWDGFRKYYKPSANGLAYTKTQKRWVPRANQFHRALTLAFQAPTIGGCFVEISVFHTALSRIILYAVASVIEINNG